MRLPSLIVSVSIVATFLVPPSAAAATITWHWAGPVTGYAGSSAPTLDTVVPPGTMVNVFVTFDPEAPYQNQAQCLHGQSSASLQVLGRTYTGTGFVWVDGYGFWAGGCAAGANRVEIVAPAWGWGGPALPDGWVPFSGSDRYFPGLVWNGDLTSVQPTSIDSYFPQFYRPGQSGPQSFTANLQAVTPVPEPSTLLLLGTALSAAAARRAFKRRLR